MCMHPADQPRRPLSAAGACSPAQALVEKRLQAMIMMMVKVTVTACESTFFHLRQFREQCGSLRMLVKCREAYSVILDVCMVGVTPHRREMDCRRLEHKLLGMLEQFKGKVSDCELSGDVPLL